MSYFKLAKFISAKMQVLEPVRAQSKLILKRLREHFGIDFVKDPEFRKYITFRSDSSNKFHYFGVLKTKDGKYAVANVYGRIGYPKPQVVELGVFDDKSQAISVATKKLNAKLGKGYQITPLP